MGTLSKGTGAVAGISQRQERYKRSAPDFLIILAALVLLLGFSMVLSVCTGIAGGSFKVFAETVMFPAKASGVGMIMLEMRMPRALAAGLTGMAFALSGAVMQGITRNPLSDAGLLGINAGAGFFVALSAILFPAASDIVKTCAAFAGAALAVFMVYGFGAGKHRSESFRFILAGAAVSALLTALSQAVSLAFGIVKSLSFWSAGSLSGVTWQSLKNAIPGDSLSQCTWFAFIEPAISAGTGRRKRRQLGRKCPHGQAFRYACGVAACGSQCIARGRHRIYRSYRTAYIPTSCGR